MLCNGTNILSAIAGTKAGRGTEWNAEVDSVMGIDDRR
jgi:hypothetical protein